jgi:hypothetical protein
MKIKKFLHHLTICISLGASVLLLYAAFLFLKYNQPIIKNFILMSILIYLPIIFILAASIRELKRVGNEGGGQSRERSMLVRIMFLIFTILTAGILTYILFRAANLDHFQTFSFYDDLIYISLVGFGLLILRMIIDAVRYLINMLGSRHTIYFNIAILFLLAVIAGWIML